ncbi:MAG: SCO1664 family protein, partial [Jatrophihabitans sp.]
ERPLWDYPDGTLAEREVAIFLLTAATGWDLVPATVLRAVPLGNGMVQLWIDDDESFDIVNAINAGSYSQLQRMALLDAILNNSDRKVSHLLPVSHSPLHEGRLHIFGVDHGVSLSVDNKLRTVLWQWAGDPLPAEAVAMLGQLSDQLAGPLGEQLGELLTTAEVRAVQRRVRRLLAKPKFPMPPTDWPAIPYPPY